MQLRNYQKEANASILDCFKRVNSVLLVLATGLGKTICFSHIAKEFIPKGRVMLLAHREELITQGAEKMRTITNVEADIEMADQFALDNYFKSDIVVSTIQTQTSRGGRMNRFNPDEFSLLIIDEGHHATADTYKRVIEYYRQNENLKVLGVTATPDRTDREALGQIFEESAYEYDIADGVGDSWLVPIKQRSIFVKSMDFSECRTTAGDLNGKDLAKIMEFEETLHEIAGPTIELTGDRKTLIFAASVAHADRLSEILNRHKPNSAKYVCGKTPKEDRRKMFKDYKYGRFQYLVNVGVATEGFDEPNIEVIVMARPTKSRCLYTQMAGRGTRPIERIAYDLNDCGGAATRKEMILRSGKPFVEIIDFVGNCGKHKLMTTADVLGGKYSDTPAIGNSETVVERATKNAQEKGTAVDMQTELKVAEKQLREERLAREAAAKRQNVLANVKYGEVIVDPFATFDIVPWEPKPQDRRKQPTKAQLDYLQNNGVNSDDLNFRQASQIIGECKKKQDTMKCSSKQAKLLTRYGYNPKKFTKKQASGIIGKLANNGWKPLTKKKKAEPKQEYQPTGDFDYGNEVPF